MSQNSLSVLLFTIPLIIGVIIAAINTDSINDATEKSEAWSRRQQATLSLKKGWFSRFILSPILSLIVFFCNWTDSFTHRGLKNGTRVTASLYLIIAWCLLIYAVFVIGIMLAIAALVIYFVVKLVVKSDSDLNRGFETGKNVVNFGNRNRSVRPQETKEGNEYRQSNRGGYFRVRAVWKNGSPANDVGVMIEYSGIMGGIDEKRTNSDGWTEFHNENADPGTIWIHDHNMGEHSLSDGKTYSFTI